MKGRSTEDALLYAEHVIRTKMFTPGLKIKGTVCAVSFDIRKAFDRVPFNDLLSCLDTEFHVPICLIAWLSSYFNGRVQYVRVDGSTSSASPVKAGVIQGSVLGPLLFAAYFNSVTRDIRPTTASVKFADDLLLIHRLNSPLDEHELQLSIQAVANAMRTSKLSLNSAKTCFGLFSESSRPYVPASPPKVDGVAILRADKLDYLGVCLDSKLSFAENTTRVVAKAKQAIGRLKRVSKNTITRNHMRTIILQKVLPVMTYGVTCTYPRHKRDRIKLERLNRFVCRTVSNDYNTSYGDLLVNCDCRPVFQHVLHRRVLLGYRYYCKERHQPSNIFRDYVADSRLRRRHHSRALALSDSTGLM
jgi:hypothetical protein